MTVLSTTSNCASGNGSDSANAVSNVTSTFARLAFFPALSIISVRRIDAADNGVVADAPFCGDGERPCSASDVEHRFTRHKAREVEEPFPQLALTPQRYEREQQVITGGPVDDASVSRCRRNFSRRHFARRTNFTWRMRPFDTSKPVTCPPARVN
jgi:hypothetical protein